MSEAPPISFKAIETLHALDVLDTLPEAQFQALVRIAAAACATPVSLISLLDLDRQWFKANVGLEHVTETARDTSFCAHAVQQHGVFEIADARVDPRFADNPLVVGDPNIRFYAGAPIRLSNGAQVGALCVIDHTPRALDDAQRQLLLDLAGAAGRSLEMGISAQRKGDAARLGLHPQDARADVRDAVISIDAEGRIRNWNDPAATLFGFRARQVIGHAVTMLVPERLHAQEADAFERLAECGMARYTSLRRRADGSEFEAQICLAADIDTHGRVAGTTKFVRASCKSAGREAR